MDNHIKAIREKRGLTRKELSECSGIHYKKIADYENNYIKTENITVGSLYHIAKALQVTLDDLCRDESEKLQ